MKSLANRADGYLVAGFQEGRLTIWRQDGTVFVASVPVQRIANDYPSLLGPEQAFLPMANSCSSRDPIYKANYGKLQVPVSSQYR